MESQRWKDGSDTTFASSSLSRSRRVLWRANVSAQPLPEHGGRVFGLVGGSFGDGGSSPFTAAGAGLRLSRNLGLDIEVLHIHDLDLSDNDFFIQRFGVPEHPAAATL